MQYFHWYTPSNGTLWKQLKDAVKELAAAGITAVWLPPAYKGVGGTDDVGYGVYDLFDLGEFDQKGSIRTKYGTRDEYIAAIQEAHDAGIQVYGDIVFNHKLGADHLEEFKATPYDPQNRNKPIGELQQIKGWTHFSFPGRNDAYSAFHWHWHHFSAADYNAFDDTTDAVYLFEGKSFAEEVDQEKGNFDYLMGCDLDISNPDVREELIRWGEWYLETAGIDGFRFDAVKHVKASFFIEWLTQMRLFAGRELFAVGEYWSPLIDDLKNFLESTDHSIMLFDAGLHYNFAEAGRQGGEYDMRRIFSGTLVETNPLSAVTIVSNHDTQPLQSLESVVESWFKPLAYALILLRCDGYPCIFSADYYGAEYSDTGHDGEQYDVSMPNHRWIIDKLLTARSRSAYGDQIDYFDHPNCIGWTRMGDDDHPSGIAVVLSNGEAGSKWMQTRVPNGRFVDITEHNEDPVLTDDDGWGEFLCPGRSMGVYVWT